MDDLQSKTIGKVVAAMVAVMRDVTHVEKSGRNEFHKYKYASDYDITSALHTAMATHGLVPLAIKADVTTAEHGTSSKGQKQWRTDLKQTFRFYCEEEWLTCESPGCGIDGEDKGVYKALTGAMKYLLTGSFVLPRGDDPEKDSDLAERSRAASGPPRSRAAASPPPPPPDKKGLPVPPPQGLEAAINAAASSKELLVCIDGAKALEPVESARLLVLAQERLRERIMQAEDHAWRRYSAILAKIPEAMRNNLMQSYRDRGRELGAFGKGAEDGPR